MVGGPNTPVSGGESNATLALTPGRFMLFCDFPAAVGLLHVMKGVQKTITVTKSTRQAPRPSHDVATTLTDHDFVFSRAITPEIGNHGRATRAQHILRLDVAMHDTARVSIDQCLCHIAPNAQRFRRRRVPRVRRSRNDSPAMNGMVNHGSPSVVVPAVRTGTMCGLCSEAARLISRVKRSLLRLAVSSGEKPPRPRRAPVSGRARGTRATCRHHRLYARECSRHQKSAGVANGGRRSRADPCADSVPDPRIKCRYHHLRPRREDDDYLDTYRMRVKRRFHGGQTLLL